MDSTLADLLTRLYGLAGDGRKKLSDILNYDNLRTAGEVASMTPTPLGDVMSGLLAVDDLRKGDYWGAAGNAVGLLPFVPALGTKFYHGSKSGVDWLVGGGKFDTSAPSANMPSKYLWANKKQDIADRYAGLDEMSSWKAEQGWQSPAPKTAGVASFELKPGTKKFNLSQKDQIANYGIDMKSPDWLEQFMDALRKDGYDAMVNSLDGNNVAILNPDVVFKTKKVR